MQELPYEGVTGLRLAGAVLLALLLAKTAGPVPYLGPALLSGAAFLQLYLPMWRCERRELDYSAIGLSLHAWQRDVVGVLMCLACCMPMYWLALHLYLTELHSGLRAAGHFDAAAWVPQAIWAPHGPQGVAGWFATLSWFVPMAATHLLGVALPEEAFYRGYLQPQLQHRWPPRRRLLGVAMGLGVLLSSALFALGHVLGEWNLARLAPFFPSLLFAWLRNRSRTIVGSITFHGLCNICSELLFQGYHRVS